jgi:cell wall-associated NlpC family hydrolase
VNWDPIIRCESSGNPKAANRRSTASGLLQFLDSSWAAYGGLKYSRRAKDATPAQQLEIANNAYARSRLTPWAASKRCWGPQTRQILAGKASSNTPAPDPAGETRVTPAPTPAVPAPVPPRPEPTVPPGVQLGVRDSDGRGWYRCTLADLRFDDCDPRTVGQLFQYPVYAGRSANPLPPLGDAAGIKPETAGSPAVQPPPPPAAPAAAPPAVAAAPAPLGAAIVATARTWTGTPYRYGGTSRSGLDCSALVQNVLRAHGIQAPRTANQQMRWARQIPKAQAGPGSLVFGVTASGFAHHVGIYLGNGTMIDAPAPGRTVGVHALYRDSRVFALPPGE